MKIKYSFLIKCLLILLICFIGLNVIKISKVLNLCCLLIKIILPVFMGFTIGWILKPVVLFINKKFTLYLSTCITFLIIGLIIVGIGYLLLPVLINELGEILPLLINFYHNNLSGYININNIIKYIINCGVSIKDIIIVLFYSFFFSFFFITNNRDVSYFIGKYLPCRLIYNISISLRGFIKGTIIDTIILFVLTYIIFFLIRMPYVLLLSIVISITNIIPFIGPYIGGIPAVIIALSRSTSFGIVVLCVVIFTQFIESSFIHPFVISKQIKISPVFILFGLILFSYLFGVVGMIISTPVLCVIKCLMDYYDVNLNRILDK